MKIQRWHRTQRLAPVLAGVAALLIALLGCSGLGPAGSAETQPFEGVPTGGGEGQEADLIAVLADRSRSDRERCATVGELGRSGTARALSTLGWAWAYGRLSCSSQEVPHAMQSICAREGKGPWCETISEVARPLPPIVTHADFNPQRGQHEVSEGRGGRKAVRVERVFAQGPAGETISAPLSRTIEVGPVRPREVDAAASHAAARAWADLSTQLLTQGKLECARDAAERGHAELDRSVDSPDDVPAEMHQVWRARNMLAFGADRKAAFRVLRETLSTRLQHTEQRHPRWRVR